MDNIQKGQYYVKKLMDRYKAKNLNYLQLCDITRKVYKSFNLNGDGTLD